MLVVQSVILMSELQTNSLGQLPVNFVYWILGPEDSHFRDVFTFHTLIIKEKSHRLRIFSIAVFNLTFR